MPDQISTGEIFRSQQALSKQIADLRVEMSEGQRDLTLQLNRWTGIMAALQVKTDSSKERIDELQAKVDDVTSQANKVSGIGVALAFVVSLLTGLFSGHAK